MRFNLQSVYNNKKFTTIKVLPLAAALLLSTSAFTQTKKTKTSHDDGERVELKYKQRHSNLIAGNDNLYADGIKIKRDLSLLKEVQEQRILSADEIPSEELYGGVWVNNRVAAYNDVLQNAPDTFKVNLSDFTMPTMGHVTSVFGPRRRRMHYGMDLKVQTGDTIYAAFDGKVRVQQYERRGYGYYLVVRHANGLETVYGHLSAFLVGVDDVVKSGDPIGLGGNTGRSFGSHLHFEMRYLGKHIDPREIVDFDNKVCHKDTYTITPRTFNYRGSKYVTGATYLAGTNSKTSTGKNKYTSGSVDYHRVRSGETLSTIARKYGTSITKIRRLNNMTAKSVLKAGKTIRVS